MNEITATFKMWERVNAPSLAKLHSILEDEAFAPDRVGSFEPLNYRFKEFDADSFTRIVLDSGILLTSRDSSPRQTMTIINVDKPKKPNRLTHSATLNGLDRLWLVRRYFHFIKRIADAIPYEYGFVCHKKDWYRKNMNVDTTGKRAVGIDLRRYLPGIYWANFFGPQYIRLFGETRLLNTPAYHVERLGPGGILLLAYENPLDYNDPEVAEIEGEIVRHLGSEAFFSKMDPPSKQYLSPNI